MTGHLRVSWREPAQRLRHGYRLRIAARGDALDHHVLVDDAAELAVLAANPKLPHPELAHQMTRLPQGLSLADTGAIRNRNLRAGHPDTPCSVTPNNSTARTSVLCPA